MRPQHVARNILLAVTAAATITGSAAYGLAQVPPPGDQLPPNNTPLLVTITQPIDQEIYPAGAVLNIRAEAVGAVPLVGLELWVDGTLTSIQPQAIADSPYALGRWEWEVPPGAEHTLLVRARDNQGRVGLSNLVRVGARAAQAAAAVFTARTGDTLTSLASESGAAPFAMAAANPGWSLDETIPAGTEVKIPFSLPAPASAPGEGALAPPPVSPPFGSGVGLWYETNVSSQLGRAVSLPPAAPALQAAISQCGVALTIADAADNETGFFVYRLLPSSNFTRIATLGPHRGSGPFQFVDKGLAGKYQYYAAAFNSAGETPSNFVSAEVGGACGQASTDFTRGNPALTAVLQYVDRYYLYVTFDNQHWQKVPAPPQRFLTPGQYPDLGSALSPLIPAKAGAVTVRGEAWGWQSGVLKKLGDFEQTFAPSSVKLNLTTRSFTPPTQLWAASTVGAVDTKYIFVTDYTMAKFLPLMFKWSSGAYATHGLWQVSTQPFFGGLSLSPPGLALTDKAGAEKPGVEAFFPIDLGPLAPQPLEFPKTGVEQVSPTQAQVPVPSFPPFAPPYDVDAVFNVGGAAGIPPKPPSVYQALAQALKAADSETRFYVRITPMIGNQPAGPPSNTVVIHYDPTAQTQFIFPAPPTPPPFVTFYEVKIAKFEPIHLPEDDWLYCVKITENKLAGKQFVDPLKQWWSAKKVGETVCPGPAEDEGNSILDKVGGAIKDGLDFLSDLSNKVTDFLVEWVEKLNPACIQAKWVSSAVGTGQKQVQDACHYIAKISVEAAKAYFGIPPSFPNYDQLTSLGKDYVVQVAVQELEAQGIPCPQECKDLLAQGVDLTVNQVKNSLNNSSCYGKDKAHSLGIEPLCAPDGVKTVPDPRGQYGPALAQLLITRKGGTGAPQVAQPDACTYSVSVDAENSTYAGQTLYLKNHDVSYKWQGTAISARLFHVEGGPLPPLAPGASVTVPVALTAEDYWLPGHYQWTKKWIFAPNYDDWYYLYKGASATVTADGYCHFPGFAQYYQYGSYYQNYYGSQPPHVQGDTQTYGPLGEAYLHVPSQYP